MFISARAVIISLRDKDSLRYVSRLCRLIKGKVTNTTLRSRMGLWRCSFAFFMSALMRVSGQHNAILFQPDGKVSLVPTTGPQGSGRLRPPDSVTSALEGGRLSAIRPGRLYPQEYPGIHLRGWVDPRHMELLDATEKIPSDATGDRSRDLPTSSAVP
jgi:hypothetical protein